MTNNSVKTATNNSDPYSITTADIKKAVCTHELGHQFNFIWGEPATAGNTGPTSYAHELLDDYNKTGAGGINVDSCATVFGTTPVINSGLCSLSMTNSLRLENWLSSGGSANPDLEIFCSLFQYYLFPGTSYAQVEGALSYLPKAKAWIAAQIAAT